MNTRDRVMRALEIACVQNEAIFFRLMEKLKNDEQAAQYGAHAPRLVVESGVSVSTVRRVLESEVAAGNVLRHKMSYGPVSYWPVGLWTRLQ